MKLLAIDPGITTGIATYIREDGVGTYNTCVIPKSFEAVYSFITQMDWDVVILEGFATPGLIASYGIDTVELIGAIKALCWLRGMKLVVQYPIERRGNLEDAKRMMTEVLKNKHYQTHERDALSHILTYMRKTVNKARRET